MRLGRFSPSDVAGQQQNAKLFFRGPLGWISILFLISTFSGFAESRALRATFAGGCYWCMEEAMEKVEGVISVTSGFEEDVEAVDVQYDPHKITYKKLLEAFWKNVDPTDAGGQFCDRGSKYRSAIFYYDESQRTAATQSRREIENFLNRSVATEVTEASLFSVAPEEDQDYYKKEPALYKQYKAKCGRVRRLQELWGPAEERAFPVPRFR